MSLKILVSNSFLNLCVCANIFRTLMRVFPNAKVVLTVRDPEKWYESVKGTIFQNREFVQGTIGLFSKLVGRFRMLEVILGASNQGPPVNKLGTYIFRLKRLKV